MQPTTRKLTDPKYENCQRETEDEDIYVMKLQCKIAHQRVCREFEISNCRENLQHH